MFISEFSLTGPKGENQDATFFAQSDNGEIVALVADGVGGSKGGKDASKSVQRAAEEAVHLKCLEPEFIIEKAYKYVNSLQNPSAATTATVVCCNDTRLTFAHTGDSRVYLLRGDGIKTLTSDQTEVALLVKEGVLTKDAAKTYRRRNVLMHSIEKGAPLSIQKGFFDLRSGDRIILITDGIYKILSKKEIYEISTVHRDGASFLSAIKSVVQKKIEDDASIVLIDI